jgi:hypothetical protein
MTKKVSNYIKNRRKLKKQNHPREVVGYFLQTNKELIRDEFGRLQNMYDKYIRGKAFQEKINTFDGISIPGMSDAFFIDFTEFKPKVKVLTAHETMLGIIKKAATDGVISKGLASSFKVGKITAPVVDGKIELDGLEFDKLEVKPAKFPKKKPLTILGITKEVHDFLLSKGYVASGEKGEIQLDKKSVSMKVMKKGKKTIKRKEWTQYRSFFLSDGKTKFTFESFKGTYAIRLERDKVYEMFIKPHMTFDDTDKKVLIEMLKRLGIKPSKKSSVSTQQYKSKGTKTKVTTIALKGKKFSVTGTLTGFTRDAFVMMAEKLGGKFQNHITKDLDMLIVGEKPGKTKLAEAKKYGVEIVKFNDIMLMHDSK